MRVIATDRFWNKVEITDWCWLWQGYVQWNGYGRLRFEGKMYLAHRFAYESLVGPITKGMTIDHICRVRNCVNPEHLRVVTSGENTLAGQGEAAKNARKTHCKRGHPLSGENLFVARDGRRRCRKCRTAWTREYMREYRAYRH